MVRARYILPISAVVVFLMVSSTALAAYGDPWIYYVNWPKTQTFTHGDTVVIPFEIKDRTSTPLEVKVRLIVTYPDGHTTHKSKVLQLTESNNCKSDSITFKIGFPNHEPPGNYGGRLELVGYGSARSTRVAFKVA